MAYTEMLDRQKHKLKSHKFVQTPDFPKSHKFLTCIQLYNTGQYEHFIMQYKPSNILRVFPLYYNDYKNRDNTLQPYVSNQED